MKPGTLKENELEEKNGKSRKGNAVKRRTGRTRTEASSREEQEELRKNKLENGIEEALGSDHTEVSNEQRKQIWRKMQHVVRQVHHHSLGTSRR